MLKIKSLGFRRCYSRRKRKRCRRKRKKRNKFDMSSPSNSRITLLQKVQALKGSEITKV
jgi:hypothetical protein